MINVSVSISRNLDKVLEDIDRRKRLALNKKIIESLEYVKQKMADFAPIRTGNLRSIILSLPITSVKTRGLSIMYGKGSIEVSVLLGRRKDKIIRWVNDGTGIYGPYRKMIYPKKSEKLVFQIDGEWIATEKVKGQKGKKFIQSAIKVSRLIIRSKILSALKS